MTAVRSARAASREGPHYSATHGGGHRLGGRGALGVPWATSRGSSGLSQGVLPGDGILWPRLPRLRRRERGEGRSGGRGGAVRPPRGLVHLRRPRYCAGWLSPLRLAVRCGPVRRDVTRKASGRPSANKTRRRRSRAREPACRAPGIAAYKRWCGENGDGGDAARIARWPCVSALLDLGSSERPAVTPPGPGTEAVSAPTSASAAGSPGFESDVSATSGSQHSDPGAASAATLLERTFGEEITTRTRDTVAKVAR